MSSPELEKQKKIFSDNLRRYLELSGKNQLDLANYIGVSTATTSDWCNNKKMPRMDKVQAICDWLHIQKSDLLDEVHENGQQKYYLNDETASLAQELHDNPDMHLVFDALRGAGPEDLQKIAEMIKVMRS